MSREIRCLRVSERGDEAGWLAGSARIGDAVGRGALGEGGRRTENASFSVGVEWVRECVVLRQVRPANGDTRAGQHPAPSSPGRVERRPRIPGRSGAPATATARALTFRVTRRAMMNTPPTQSGREHTGASPRRAQAASSAASARRREGVGYSGSGTSAVSRAPSSVGRLPAITARSGGPS